MVAICEREKQDGRHLPEFVLVVFSQIEIQSAGCGGGGGCSKSLKSLQPEKEEDEDENGEQEEEECRQTGERDRETRGRRVMEP